LLLVVILHPLFTASNDGESRYYYHAATHTKYIRNACKDGSAVTGYALPEFYRAKRKG